ncbi:MAG: endonuclease III [Anaerolineales bacterium]|nr:endonuclease III [Anaerolineales bacterium]
MEPKEFALVVHQRLLDFYGYPQWRERLPPLDELISTILSQNTNDVNRDRAFEALRQRFPTWEAVRDADEKELVDAIRTAGLANQKGPRIQNVLREITRQCAGLSLDFLETLPVEEARDWLMSFKGVGPKTAAIVLLFSLDKPAFPVDTHIQRVSGRLGLRPKEMNAEQAHQRLEGLFPASAYYPAHLNLIRLGREICHARRPECPACPLMDVCSDYAARSAASAGEPGQKTTAITPKATKGELDG